MSKIYDLTVIGAGGAGLMAAIKAATDNKDVLLLEKLSKVGAKLEATGGGKCNLTNKLNRDEFIEKFAKDGRFIRDAIEYFDNFDLIDFFKSIGVETDSLDGFRVFPITHNSKSVVDALLKKLKKLGVKIRCSQRVKKVDKKDIFYIYTDTMVYKTRKLIVATGGLGYSTLGAEGDGYDIATSLGHSISPLYPAMTPLKVKEKWVKNCRADTIAKATLYIDMKKYKKIKAKGDLIFTSDGIRGPVVLDFAREITPLLEKYEEVGIIVNMIKGLNEDALLKYIKKQHTKLKDNSILNIISTLLPKSVSEELLKISQIEYSLKFNEIEGRKKAQLLKILSSTPLSVTGHYGFDKAMITRGGISLKEINPKTMQSKIVKGLYFCGEVLDIDGPCGGYNLQWSFSSGYLAGSLL